MLPVEATIDTRTVPKRLSDGASLYDKDLWSWAREQSRALREGDLASVDWENLIEEIDDMAKRDEGSWLSFCRNTISHLLKIEHMPDDPSIGHSKGEIEDWRQQMLDKLDECPGMQSRLDEMLTQAWSKGRNDGIRILARLEARQSSLPLATLRRNWNRAIPAECPYAANEIVGYDILAPNPLGEVDTCWPPSVADILKRLPDSSGQDV